MPLSPSSVLFLTRDFSQEHDKTLLMSIRTPGVERYLQRDPELLFRHYMLSKEYPKVRRRVPIRSLVIVGCPLSLGEEGGSNKLVLVSHFVVKIFSHGVRR